MPINNTMYGQCLRNAVIDMKNHPTRKMMIGKGYGWHTAHFWTEDDRFVYDDTDDVPEDYDYDGTEVDINEVKKELGI